MIEKFGKVESSCVVGELKLVWLCHSPIEYSVSPNRACTKGFSIVFLFVSCGGGVFLGALGPGVVAVAWPSDGAP